MVVGIEMCISADFERVYTVSCGRYIDMYIS